ncbi:hypothetical protein [Bradyrhizobium septentrionale]|uniref:Apea-like HEPN domain-containing protein n=1 Tax=Bradyrhizobium septentrionale TaxID=1404411 RepID=A0ABZ2P5W6_9BRAD
MDNLGNRGGIRTHVESNEFEVAGENFQALVALADRVLNISTFKRLLSREYIEDLIFDWSILRYQDAATASFPDYLTACVERDASEHNIWMPIANLQVQEDFQFGPAGIVTIPRSLFDTSEEQWLAMGPEKASAIRAHADKLRRELQGNAAVAIAVRGEKIYARSQARSIAEDVVGLLRFFHAAAVTSSIHCPTELLGQEADPVVTTLVFDETGRFDYLKSAAYPHVRTWMLNKAQLSYMRERGQLELAASLVSEVELSDFAKRIRSSILSYSKGLTFPNISDRLVYSFSALEALFLKDASETIQQNLAERIAFTISKEPGDRMQIVARVKRIYGARSQYIHHRKDLQVTKEDLDGFFVHSWAALRTALGNVKRFETHMEYIDAIDQVKYS